jgi:hypothetical protein
LLVDGVEETVRLLAEPELGPHVGDRTGVELALRPAGSLPQAGEQTYCNHNNT